MTGGSVSSIRRAGAVGIGLAAGIAKAGNRAEDALDFHHFATNKNELFRREFQRITNKHGLDLNSAWNKELFPRALHSGRHPNEYHDFVLTGMIQADLEARGDTPRFLELFEEYVKGPVRENPALLRKSGWG